MSALVLCTRILDSVVKAMEILPMRLTVIGDSTCTISSCELSCTSQTPFFSNRVAEILDTMQSWGPESPVKATQELEEIPNDDTTMVDKISGERMSIGRQFLHKPLRTLGMVLK